MASPEILLRRPVTLIVAATTSNGIGTASRLPWRLPKEMAYFARVTTGSSGPGALNTVIMGRKTWESIPPKHKPLKGRRNIVISRNSEYDLDSPQADPPPELHSSLKSALISLNSKASDDSRIFIIGGSSLYQESLSYPCIDRVLLTRILSPSYDCDVFFPTLDDAIWKNATYTELAEFVGDVAEDAQTEGDTTYEFQMYVRSP